MTLGRWGDTLQQSLSSSPSPYTLLWSQNKARGEQTQSRSFPWGALLKPFMFSTRLHYGQHELRMFKIKNLLSFFFYEGMTLQEHLIKNSVCGLKKKQRKGRWKRGKGSIFKCEVQRTFNESVVFSSSPQSLYKITSSHWLCTKSIFTQVTFIQALLTCKSSFDF